MDNYRSNHKYDDIIGLAHHVSARHPHMRIHDRAAQFAAFDALTGFGAAVSKTSRLAREEFEP